MTENTITCTDFYYLAENIIRNFTANNRPDILAHTLKVRDNALILAKKYIIDYEQAKNAALLHNISALIPVEKYIKKEQEEIKARKQAQEAEKTE